MPSLLLFSLDDKSSESKRERSFELERIVFFSDAVFAIAITLLAIELRVPNLEIETSDALIRALVSEWPKFLAFTLSFWIIAQYWVAHHRYFRHIFHYDVGLIWLNLLLLFWIVLIPFTTSVLGEYGNFTSAIWLYALNLIALGLSNALLWRHATQKHRLGASDLDELTIRQMQLRALSVSVAAVIVILLTFVVDGFATFGFLLIFVFQRLITKRYPSHAK